MTLVWPSRRYLASYVAALERGWSPDMRRSLATQLYEVQPMDPPVVALVAAVLCTVGLIACAVPARRASRINPLVALTDQ